MTGTDFLRASTDSTRKAQTLRRMAARLDRGVPLHNPQYLNEIADDYMRVYAYMVDARRRLMLIEKFPNNRRIKCIAASALVDRHNSDQNKENMS